MSREHQLLRQVLDTQRRTMLDLLTFKEMAMAAFDDLKTAVQKQGDDLAALQAALASGIVTNADIAPMVAQVQANNAAIEAATAQLNPPPAA